MPPAPGRSGAVVLVILGIAGLVAAVLLGRPGPAEPAPAPPSSEAGAWPDAWPDAGSGPGPVPGAAEGAAAGTRPDGVPDDAEPAVVDRVVDGDTIRVRVDDPHHSIPPTWSVRVRLLNIDAPEHARDDRPAECGAGAATGLLEQLLPAGATVWLTPDAEDRDVHDRPLRYAFTGGGVDVQAALVRAGLAEVVVFEPNDRFADRLWALQAAAHQRSAGMWGELCPA